FEKPKTSPAAFKPADTTVLSPHMKFGTLSPRLFHQRIQQLYQETTKHSQPPVSLLGQILWREFYYTPAAGTPNFGKMEGNPICLQVDWWCKHGPTDARNADAEKNLKAWSNGETGYPWIDAIMTQLRKEGWIHHLARHSVACFLTRGACSYSLPSSAAFTQGGYDFAIVDTPKDVKLNSVGGFVVSFKRGLQGRGGSKGFVSNGNSGLIWAYSSKPVSEIDNPNSRFLQHDDSGGFELNIVG
ncbi:(6-4)DNA photolyase, partial [Blyttiomyces sp. JEL0837]